MPNKVFVCGGNYLTEISDQSTKFKLVRNSGPPYVKTNEEDARKMFTLCQHHSHLYEINMDTGEVNIWEKSDNTTVSSDHPYILPADLMLGIKERLRMIE